MTAHPSHPRSRPGTTRPINLLVALCLGLALWLWPCVGGSATASATHPTSPASASTPDADGHASPMMPSRDWPTGQTSAGQPVSWTAHRSVQTSFDHATGWWGAATTKIRVRGPRAPHVYAFYLRLPSNVHLVKDAFGEIVATRHGHKIGILGQPWAKDSRGRHLTTSYSVHRHVVKQHIRFGPHTHFPVTADPWWNPFTWHWGSLFSIAWSEVRACGKGAVTTMSYLAGPTAATNILLVHAAGRTAVMLPGGAYAYAGLGVYGCIGSYFGSD